jgi:hypothetical protein
VRLVISDHHLGLKAAIATVFVCAAWQRCRVHCRSHSERDGTGSTMQGAEQKGRLEVVLVDNIESTASRINCDIWYAL